jgi:carbonic anhydrase/acetyltransferase-like protein (isoleucine patch superfamily)
MKLETGQNGSIITYKGITPKIHESAFLCEGVRIVGDVEIGEDCSVWYNSVIRGDVHYIKIGRGTNVQDLCMLHVTNNKYALNIGEYVTVGHSVTLHGCTVKDRCLIGIGATVLDNAVVSSNSLIGAGALVKEGFFVPEGVLVAGVPAKIVRDLSEAELIWVRKNAENYVGYTKEYRQQLEI